MPVNVAVRRHGGGHVHLQLLSLADSGRQSLVHVAGHLAGAVFTRQMKLADITPGCIDSLLQGIADIRYYAQNCVVSLNHVIFFSWAVCNCFRCLLNQHCFVHVLVLLF